MKKSALLFVLLPVLAVAGFAQESRQDASVSATGFFPPFVSGNSVQQTSTYSLGGLASYRYMLTPRSAVEGNYQYTEYTNKYVLSFLPNVRIHTRFQEASAAYVYNFNFKHWNPFLEGGFAGLFYSPLRDASTNYIYATKRQTGLGALYGGGIAYEISPSFDIRVEYRGIVTKAPDFGQTQLRTNRYFNISNPAIGIAYHF
jgi:outer membrane immunogenic protein